MVKLARSGRFFEHRCNIFVFTDKYKSLLLQGNGASILVQKLHNDAATGNISTEVDKVSEETNSDQTSNLEASTIANVCCAIANFATNGSQLYTFAVDKDI
jgi:septal ring-binding cell division protein DamX